MHAPLQSDIVALLNQRQRLFLNLEFDLGNMTDWPLGRIDAFRLLEAWCS